MGRRRESVTAYHYDDDGRLTHAVTVHDERFTDADVDELLARHTHQQLQCPGCGHPRDEVWPVDADHALKLDGQFHAQPLQCAACAARDKAQQRQRGDESHGIYWTVERKDSVDG